LRAERDWFEADGVPEAVLKLFSKGRKEIDEALRSYGVSSAVAAETANNLTRPRKEHADEEELRKAWQEAAEAIGFSSDDVERLIGQEVESPLSRQKQA